MWKTKAMLGLIWVGSVTLMGAADTGADKSLLDWLLTAIHAGLLAGLAVALRHYYHQIKLQAIRDYRFGLMWASYIKQHGLDNGKSDDDD